MIKYDRKYKLQLEKNPRAYGDPVPTDPAAFATIELPYTLEFTISRGAMSAANTASFTVYNLSQKTREQVFFDQFNMDQYKSAKLWAGYGDSLSLVFNGNIQQSWSHKPSGSNNVLTEIQAREGAFQIANGYTTQQFNGSQSYDEVLKRLCLDMPFMDTPIVSKRDNKPVRSCALSGNTWKLIETYSNGDATIDNNRIVIVKEYECIGSTALLINAETGLLGSPYRANKTLEFTTLFTPQLEIGMAVRIESQINPQLNGFYKVVGFTHNGTISSAVAGDATTTVQLWLGMQTLTWASSGKPVDPGKTA